MPAGMSPACALRCDTRMCLPALHSLCSGVSQHVCLHEVSLKRASICLPVLLSGICGCPWLPAHISPRALAYLWNEMQEALCVAGLAAF